jgi:hypothetical protein
MVMSDARGGWVKRTRGVRDVHAALHAPIFFWITTGAPHIHPRRGAPDATHHPLVRRGAKAGSLTNDE